MINVDAKGLRWAPMAPASDLDYTIDWSDWLEPGETIAVSAWSVIGGPDTILLTRAQLLDGSVASVFAFGGVIGGLYTLKNTITTSDGRIDNRTIQLRCQQR
jgi:hypothetical protein